jgi:HAD superfamily hydrolase (TIGR01490 family)
MTKRPFAVFDIDGTLIRWQLYHAIVDSLHKSGLINDTEFESMHEARMRWKYRAGEDSFNDYQTAIINLYENAIANISYDQYLAAAHKVFDEYKDQTYTYTRDLIKELKAKNYLLFAISASQVEIVKMLAEYYGFSDWAGSVYEVNNGKFTGQKSVLKGSAKPLALKKLIQKHGASYIASVAVGDSEGDIPMLEAVELPIAFNPSKKLFNHAKSSGWKIALERKNLAYELEPRNGSYQLAN